MAVTKEEEDALEALKEVMAILEKLPPDSQIRVLQATATFYGITL